MSEIIHGTDWAYDKHKCKCKVCKAAKAKRGREYRLKRAEMRKLAELSKASLSVVVTEQEEEIQTFFTIYMVHRNRRFYMRCKECMWQSQLYLWESSAEEAGGLHQLREHSSR